MNAGTTTRRKRRRINRFRFTLLLLAVLLLTAGCAGAGYTFWLVQDAPAFNPEQLAISETSVIYDKDGNEAAKIYGAENRTPVKIKDVPKVVKDAFLATEDVRFYEHHGVDFRALARAAVAQVTGGWGSQGASTLTQQLVKNAFLTPEKTVKRKIQEMYLAIQLERKYTKDEIFEMYLNRIFFGHNSYGIEAAAQTYFGKSVGQLNLAEAAMLAGIPQAPSRYSPIRNPELAKTRRAHVLDNMAHYGFITQAQANAAKLENFDNLNQKTVRREQSYPYAYFVEYVQEQLEEKFGPNKVYAGGLQVYTTLDPKVQKAAEEALSNKANFPRSTKDENGLIQPQAAAVILEPGTGYLRAIVGGRGQTDSGKRLLNRASQSRRQPGSAFKPIIAYGPAIEYDGAGPATVVDDSPVKFGSYSPKNSDGKYGGLTTLRSALTRSVNVVAVKLLEQTKISQAIKFARKLGISSESLDPEKDSNLAIALGGLSRGVTPLEMAGAYGTFASGGTYAKPTVILKVKDASGNILEDEEPARRQAIKPTTAYLLTNMLQDVVKYGTGTRAQLRGWAVAGKTGTTNDGKDIWFAGYTSRLVGIVWMGHDQPKSMPRQYGGLYPAKIWRQIMAKALEGKTDAGFKKPGGLEYATVCKLSGKKPSALCPTDELTTEVFAAGTAPTEECNLHEEVNISASSGLLASPSCPDVISKVFIKRSASKVAMPGMTPTKVCDVHGKGGPAGTEICIDPAHDGELYLANVPGPDQEGGCPPESREVRTFDPGKEPTAYCPLPDHQVRPKSPEVAIPKADQVTGPEKVKDPEKVRKPKAPTSPAKTTN